MFHIQFWGIIPDLGLDVKGNFCKTTEERYKTQDDGPRADFGCNKRQLQKNCGNWDFVPTLGMAETPLL
jgi:hypothetical protein